MTAWPLKLERAGKSPPDFGGEARDPWEPWVTCDSEPLEGAIDAPCAIALPFRVVLNPAKLGFPRELKHSVLARANEQDRLGGKNTASHYQPRHCQKPHDIPTKPVS